MKDLSKLIENATSLPWVFKNIGGNKTNIMTVINGSVTRFAEIKCLKDSDIKLLKYLLNNANSFNAMANELSTLSGAVSDVLPDLRHYVDTHGPGPGKRLEKLLQVLGIK